MELIHLASRALLGLKGRDAHELLQATCTQDVRKLANTPLLYGAHLTPQGRLVGDFLFFEQDDYLMLDIHKDALMHVARGLHKFKAAMDVSFEDLTDDYAVLVNMATAGEGLPDPRLPALGRRVYAPQVPTEAVDEMNFETVRIQAGVPDGWLESPVGKALPAELGLQYLQGIAFDKGCYVGQEVTARLQFRGAAKKAVYLCDYAGDAEPHTSVTLATGNDAGWLGSHANGIALVVLPTRHAEKNLFVADVPLKNLRLPPHVKQGKPEA